MALKDMVKNAASAAIQQTQEAVQDAVSRDRNAAEEQGAHGIAQGFLGNYSELNAETVQEQYGMYLMSGERFTHCFALLRDKLLFTDKRIIFIDHQGMSGQKARVESINLGSIVSVHLETSGMGFDHAELSFFYFASPYYKAHQTVIESKTLEFPKRFDVQTLYRMLEELAYSNIERLNA